MAQVKENESEIGKLNKPKSEPIVRKRIPLKLLEKPYAGLRSTRLVASSKVLHNVIPTQNCDIILTLPEKTDDDTLMWLLARLRMRTPQILVHVRHWKNTGVYVFFMTANLKHMLKGAEEIGIRKKLKPEFGGGQKEFLFDDQDSYSGIEDMSTFLTSEERQSILYYMLMNLRAVQGDCLNKVKFLEGQSIVPILHSRKIVTQIFPLHDNSTLTNLRKSWVQTFVKYQPLDKVCEYFGVKVAMYFAYLGHYTSALIAPSALGVVFWLVHTDDQLLEDLCFVMFALFNVFWATVYTEKWRRRSSELAYRWGTLDKKDELLQDPRPLYSGNLITSTVTGRLEPSYPSWKRNVFRYCVSLPVIMACLIAVFYWMLVIFHLQEWVNDHVQKQEIIFPSFCQLVPKILLAVSIGIMDEIYKKIAFWLNDKENYRMDETYENHLIIKLVLFQFVNSFLSLFYIAFYLQDMDRLRDHLATLLITRQVIGNLREALLPYILWKMKLMRVGYSITSHMSPNTLEKEIEEMKAGSSAHRRFDSKGKSTSDEQCPDADTEGKTLDTSDSASELILSQAEFESTMQKYEGTFDDYLEMFIQYGYVILFSSAFPLAALCALLNNVIEIRSDAFKMCMCHQRPFGKQVRNIGIWLDALRVMGMIAVVVNSALIGVSGLVMRVKPDMDKMSAILVIIVLEHVIMILKVCIRYAIPSQPQWIKEEMACLEFKRREALKNVRSHLTSPREVPKVRPQRSFSSTTPSNELCNPHFIPVVPARCHQSSLSSLALNQDDTPSSGNIVDLRDENLQDNEILNSATLDTTGSESLSVFSSVSTKSESIQDSPALRTDQQRCSWNAGERVAYAVSNLEARLQTRQRILQSAKNRYGDQIDNIRKKTDFDNK